MTRHAPRARRSAAAKPVPSRVAGSGTADDSLEQAWRPPLELARSLLGATLSGSREWVQGLCDWQDAQAACLTHAGERLADAAGQAERATDWPSLWAVQASLASQQWTQALQDMGALVDRALEIENRWLERCQADAARLSQHGSGGGNGWASAPAALAASAASAAEATAALAMLSQAQSAMDQVSRLWAPVLHNTARPD